MNYLRLVITDGRQAMLDEMISSFDWYSGEQFRTIVIDDSGDREYEKWLCEQFDPETVWSHPTRRGLAEAIRSGWAVISLFDNIDYVIHLEDDCTFTHDINVDVWSQPLRDDVQVAQVVLQRGPNNEDEHAHGGILNAWAAAGVPTEQRDGYVVHQHLFSLQPNIYRASLCREGWPEHGGEREFTDQLLAKNPHTKFAYLGTPDSEPVYIHAGYGQRSAGWVL